MSSQSVSVARVLDRHAESRTDTQINASNDASFTNGVRHDVDFDIRHSRLYKVAIDIDCSLDITTSNFISQLLVDGVAVRLMAEEFKDSGGGSIGGSGTDQRLPNRLTALVNLTKGARNFEFRFRPQANGVEATVHYSCITVERWI